MSKPWEAVLQRCTAKPRRSHGGTQVPQAKFSYDLSPVEVVISYSRRRCHGAMGGVQKYSYFVEKM
jgi:hypothetical protein